MPHLPGVYLFKDGDGAILYVGKAKDLRKRISSYLRHSASGDVKTRVFLGKAIDIEYLVTSGEKEALLLEASSHQEAPSPVQRHPPRRQELSGVAHRSPGALPAAGGGTPLSKGQSPLFRSLPFRPRRARNLEAPRNPVPFAALPGQAVDPQGKTLPQPCSGPLSRGLRRQGHPGTISERPFTK